MTRVLHLGDLHLRPDARNEDRLAALDEAIELGLKLGVDLWVFPGDLNHSRMSISDRNALAGRLRMMAERSPVIVCYGNHDAPGDLDVFAQLRGVHSITVVDFPRVVKGHTADDREYAVAVIPYPTKGGLLGHGLSGDRLLEVAQTGLDRITSTLAEDLALAKAGGAITFTIGHVNVSGAVSSSGQPQIGREIELAALGITNLLEHGPVMLNHIHAHQTTHGATYAGSLCRLDWGETEPKVVCCYSYMGEDDVWALDTHEMPVPPMYHVEGTYGLHEGDTVFNWAVCMGPGGSEVHPPDTWAGCDVRVRYRFAARLRGVINEDRIRAPFTAARRLVLDPIAEPEHEIRAPEVAEALGLRDKLMAWGRVAGEEPPPSALDKLAVMECHSGEDVLTLVEQRCEEWKQPVAGGQA